MRTNVVIAHLLPPPFLKSCNQNPHVSLPTRLPHITNKEEFLVHCWIKRKSRYGLVCKFEPMWTKIIGLTNRVEKRTWETSRVAKLVRWQKSQRMFEFLDSKSHIKCPITVGIVGPRKRLVQTMLVVVSIENIHLDQVITCIRAFWAFESRLSQVAPKMKKEHWCNEFINPHEGFENLVKILKF